MFGDKSMPKIYLRQSRFTYSPYGPFSNNKEQTQKFKEGRESKNIYWNGLDNECFQDIPRPYNLENL